MCLSPCTSIARCSVSALALSSPFNKRLTCQQGYATSRRRVVYCQIMWMRYKLQLPVCVEPHDQLEHVVAAPCSAWTPAFASRTSSKRAPHPTAWDGCRALPIETAPNLALARPFTKAQTDRPNS
eukprot:103517-Amphidinium_carterae.1